jgi:hypothetical protein
LIHIGVAPGSPSDRFRLDAPAASLRRVNFIERQRDQCESGVVTDARSEQAARVVAHPALLVTRHRPEAEV